MKAIFLLSILLPVFIQSNQQYKEISFKFWISPFTHECYSEILESNSTLYLFYEILNAPSTFDETISVFFRDQSNTNLLSSSQGGDRGHLAFLTNQSMTIDICFHHRDQTSSSKFISTSIHVYHHPTLQSRLENVDFIEQISMKTRTILNTIIDNLILARIGQRAIDIDQQKDSYRMNETFNWIDRWALLHCGFIFSCFLFQTLAIKRLFHLKK